jgi:hypothetical protein
MEVKETQFHTLDSNPNTEKAWQPLEWDADPEEEQGWI